MVKEVNIEYLSHMLLPFDLFKFSIRGSLEYGVKYLIILATTDILLI